MLKSIIKGAIGRLVSGSKKSARIDAIIKLVGEAHETREWREAIKLLRELTELDQKNVGALVRLGMYLLEVGEVQQAYEKFGLAYRLDDSNMEAVVHYARCMMEAGQDDQAMHMLKRAQAVIPGYPHINSVYSAIQFRRADPETASLFALRAWVSSFDGGRMPDGYLWPRAYEDKSEEALAAEHHFWGKTCLPLPEKITRHLPSFGERAPNKKMRVGYWSPDFRDHSVRYFFRPLLEGHDRSRVELVLYHDASASDAQTEEIKAHCDKFHAVYDKSDEALVKLIASHDLDVLVELAGHTSHNRLWLLQGRLARVQISGLGYPPTTGLETIDAKLVDPYLRSPGDERFYTETPLELPHSLWCFDPRGDAPEPAEPPVLKAGYITFGCFGNASKINQKIVNSWAAILKRVPRSRLLLRSVSFLNAHASARMEEYFSKAGVDRNRFTMVGPVPGHEFFASYHELDIVLDTHPFNGGTTTCFATYMGVPVVTLKGDSLISRVGASVVANVGAPELAVNDVKEYISKAVSLSQDVNFLKRFRMEARPRMKEGSLGNGKKFAQDIEAAFEKLLHDSKLPRARKKTSVIPLPPQEVIRRAVTTLGAGQWESSMRIVKYCLEYYPDYAGGHIMMTEDLTREKKFKEAAEYLLKRVGRFAESDRAAVLINIIRYQILAIDLPAASNALSLLQASRTLTSEEQYQAGLFAALEQVQTAAFQPSLVLPGEARKIKCVIPCDDLSAYEKLKMRLSEYARASKSDVTFERSSQGLKISAYANALGSPDADIVIFLQKNINIMAPDFFSRIANALQGYDVVGYSGAKRWNQLDWRLDNFDQRAAAYTSKHPEREDFSEVFLAGPGQSQQIGRIAVLEGGLLAVNASRVATIPFDEEWMDADTLLEERWSYEAGLAGARLAVNRCLGVHVDSSIGLSRTYIATARSALIEKMKFDLFSLEKTDGSMITSPVADPLLGFLALSEYLTG